MTCTVFVTFGIVGITMEHTHLPGLDEGGSDTARESIAPAEGVDLHRRAFLFGTAAVLAAHALPADADAAERKPLAGKAQPEQNDVAPKPTLEKMAENRWIVRQSPSETNGEGLRGPSYIAPRAYDAVPVMTITRADVEVQGGMDQHYLLPLPRDIGEIGRLETHVLASATGLNGMVSDLEIVESQPNNNKFLSCRIQGTPTGGKVTVEMKVLSWMSVPKTPALEGDNLLRANQRVPAIMQAMQLKTAAETQLKYEAGISPLDPAEIAQTKKGDCGTFAVFVDKASNGEFQAVVGYCALDIDKQTGKGGTHAFNLSRKGNVRVDAPHHTYGVDRGEYMVATVGMDLNFPANSPWSWASGPHKTYNKFAYSGAGRVENASTSFSVPGMGVEGQRLMQLSQKVPQEIVALHKEHEKARKQVNSPANIKKIAAATPKK